MSGTVWLLWQNSKVDWKKSGGGGVGVGGKLEASFPLWDMGEAVSSAVSGMVKKEGISLEDVFPFGYLKCWLRIISYLVNRRNRAHTLVI
jgi:hypothetical protein